MSEKNKGFSSISSLASDISDTPQQLIKEEKNQKENKEKNKFDDISAKNNEGTESQDYNSNPDEKYDDSILVILFISFAFIFSLIFFHSTKKDKEETKINYNEKNLKAGENKESNLKEKNTPTVIQPTASPSTSNYYVSTKALNVRSGPGVNNIIVNKISEFDTISVYEGSSVNGWIKINDGIFDGWVAQRYIKKGDGNIAYMEYCRTNTTRPVNGHIFYQKDSGPHGLIIKNQPTHDVIAKLKDTHGETIISFYVRAGQSVEIKTIPTGVFKFQYASGNSYSEHCGYKFLDDMHASEDPNYNQYKITTNGYYQYTSVMQYTLYRVTNGNLNVRDVPLDEF